MEVLKDDDSRCAILAPLLFFPNRYRGQMLGKRGSESSTLRMLASRRLLGRRFDTLHPLVGEHTIEQREQPLPVFALREQQGSVSIAFSRS